MTQKAQHPTSEELSAFTVGRLSATKAQEVEDHISHCDSCCETMMHLGANDTFVDLLKEVGSATHSSLDSAADRQTGPEDEIPQPLVNHSRYEVETLVGRGGMGRVFQARHRMMDRAVALKVINSEYVRRQDAIDRFRREVKAAASLDHSNIVTAYDAEQLNDLHLLVMEYVDGVDLSETVQQRGPLPVAEACDYVRQAAEGLQYAHDRGMVHRDIKPHNLMVTQGSVVKILDFGLASLAPQATPEEPVTEDSSGNLTVAGAIMGTPDFISPEQAQDARSVDGRSDIYSLGMTLYFLLTGRVPFTEGSATDKLRQHAEAQPVSLAEFRDDIPEDLQNIFIRMVAKHPDDRFQTPQEVARALQKHVAVASGGQSGSATTTHGRIVRTILGCSIALLVLCALGTIGFLWSGFGKGTSSDKVYGPLSDLDSYVVSMMTTPHDLVFLNLGEVGPDDNYMCFKPIPGGIEVLFPAFGEGLLGSSRQGKYVSRLKEVAESLSLTIAEDSEVESDGSIRGVRYTLDVTGDPETVAETIRQLITQSLFVRASEECEYTFRNLPSLASGSSENLTRVSGDEFVREYHRGERVYFGEVASQIYLIPEGRRDEKSLTYDSDVWSANINELPAGFAVRIRRNDSRAAEGHTSPAAVRQPQLTMTVNGSKGTELGDTAVHSWSLAGTDVAELSIRLLLAHDGRADIVPALTSKNFHRNAQATFASLSAMRWVKILATSMPRWTSRQTAAAQRRGPGPGTCFRSP